VKIPSGAALSTGTPHFFATVPQSSVARPRGAKRNATGDGRSFCSGFGFVIFAVAQKLASNMGIRIGLRIVEAAQRISVLDHGMLDYGRVGVDVRGSGFLGLRGRGCREDRSDSQCRYQGLHDNCPPTSNSQIIRRPHPNRNPSFKLNTNAR
jgi:hypothetical protein